MAAASSTQSPPLPCGTMRAHCVRLKPGADLVPSLLDAAEVSMKSSNTSAAFVLSAVGSLSNLTLRLARSSRRQDEEVNDMLRLQEKLEIVSLTGTFSPNKQKHLHMSVADGDGKTYGGHLVSGTVFTTLELVIGTIDAVEFAREVDNNTGYKELVVRKIEQS